MKQNADFLCSNARTFFNRDDSTEREKGLDVGCEIDGEKQETERKI